MKKISIVIPTRNRPKLLIPLLNHIKKFYDPKFFKIIVCDNSSSINNKNKIFNYLNKNFKSVEFHYKKKHIEKEQFFQWSALKVRSSHFFFLFDDDIINRRSFDLLRNIFSKSINFDFMTFNRFLSFYNNGYPDKVRKNKLDIPKFDGNLYSIRTQSHIKEIFYNLEISNQSPMVTNTIFKTDYFKHLVNKYKKIFTHGHMGDYNCAIKSLINTKKFLFLDFPIVLFGQSKINTTSQLRDGIAKSKEYISWINYYTRFKLSKMPIKCYFFLNCIASVLLEMNKSLRLNQSINYDRYFFLANKEISRLLNLKIPKFLKRNILNEKNFLISVYNRKKITEKSYKKKKVSLNLNQKICYNDSQIKMNYKNILEAEFNFYLYYCLNKFSIYKNFTIYFTFMSEMILPFSKVTNRLHRIFKNF